MPEKKQSKKEIILETAIKLFCEDGFHCTSIDDILHACDVGKGNFYYHFKSKDELGYEVLSYQLQQFETISFSYLLDSQFSPEKRVDRYFDAMYKLYSKSPALRGCPIGNLASELVCIHDGFRERIVKVYDRWQSVLSDLLKEICDRKNPSPSEAAEYLLAGWEGAHLLAKTRQSSMPFKNYTEQSKLYVQLYFFKKP